MVPEAVIAWHIAMEIARGVRKRNVRIDRIRFDVYDYAPACCSIRVCRGNDIFTALVHIGSTLTKDGVSCEIEHFVYIKVPSTTKSITIKNFISLSDPECVAKAVEWLATASMKWVSNK